VPGKHLTTVDRHLLKAKWGRAPLAALSGTFVLAILFLFVPTPRIFAQETPPTVSAPKFLGSQSCSASSCHGGAGEKSKQYTIWSTHDFHHARPYATLETARSERLAEVLKIANPAQSARCTICHAPFATVPTERLGHDVAVTEGVSCESCHGPAENWIRSHTRPDYTHADRIAAGMRDVRNLYVRANTCVACHQNIDPEIRAAGHPELIFEMDGQSATMPRHWSKTADKPGPQIWLVGQAAALREQIWQFGGEKVSPANAPLQSVGLLWVVDRSASAFGMSLPKGRFWSDYVNQFAQEVAQLEWTEALTRMCLNKLSQSSSEFLDKTVTADIHAQRAERLVLALDRLTQGLKATKTNAAVNQSLNKLFTDAQSLPDFNPTQFANDLNTFHSSVAGFLETK
jgi:Zn-finger protein